MFFIVYFLIGVSVLFYHQHLLSKSGLWDIEVGRLVDEMMEHSGNKSSLISEKFCRSIIYTVLFIAYMFMWPVFLTFQFFD